MQECREELVSRPDVLKPDLKAASELLNQELLMRWRVVTGGRPGLAGCLVGMAQGLVESLETRADDPRDERIHRIEAVLAYLADILDRAHTRETEIQVLAAEIRAKG